MKQSTTNMLMLGGAVALAWYLLRKQSALKGLGDADPAKLDVSGGEDLCNLISNCLGAEQHLSASAALPGGEKFIGPLQRMREMRRKAMAKLLPADAEGQIWCVTKHLLAASMHSKEVGDKLSAEGKPEEAKAFYEQAEELKKGALSMSAGAKAGGQCPVCQNG